MTGEESGAQIRLRGERTGAVHPALFVAAENDLSALLTHVDRIAPGLLVVDSVQTITSQGVDSSAGAVTQIRAVTSAVIALAKEREIATVLVGHVTKDGSIAGPRVLEHVVDVVLQFEGKRHSALRLIRAAKNRYGPRRVGCFEMRGWHRRAGGSVGTVPVRPRCRGSRHMSPYAARPPADGTEIRPWLSVASAAARCDGRYRG